MCCGVFRCLWIIIGGGLSFLRILTGVPVVSSPPASSISISDYAWKLVEVGRLGGESSSSSCNCLRLIFRRLPELFSTVSHLGSGADVLIWHDCVEYDSRSLDLAKWLILMEAFSNSLFYFFDFSGVNIYETTTFLFSNLILIFVLIRNCGYIL